jgi:hypothetical protein
VQRVLLPQALSVLWETARILVQIRILAQFTAEQVLAVNENQCDLVLTQRRTIAQISFGRTAVAARPTLPLVGSSSGQNLIRLNDFDRLLCRIAVGHVDFP